MTNNPATQEINDYISQFPPEIQVILKKTRETISLAAPNAVEKFSYKMPAFYQEGNLVYFAAAKKHLGFYPMPSGISAFEKELEPYHSAKGSVRFLYTEEIPYELISQIVKFRVAENCKKD